MFSSNIAQLPNSNQVTPREVCTAPLEESQFQIDLGDAIADITANIIYDSEYSQLPSDIFESAVMEAINDLVDDFALNPDSYLKSKHLKQIDDLAHEYLNS